MSDYLLQWREWRLVSGLIEVRVPHWSLLTHSSLVSGPRGLHTAHAICSSDRQCCVSRVPHIHMPHIHIYAALCACMYMYVLPEVVGLVGPLVLYVCVASFVVRAHIHRYIYCAYNPGCEGAVNRTPQARRKFIETLRGGK